MTGRKCKSLTLSEKVKVIEAHTKEKLSAKECMVKFKCGKTQIYDIIKHKDKIMQEWLTGNVKRKTKITGYEELNNLVWEWYVATRAKSLTISGPIIQAQAREIAILLGKTDFKASNGWLESFRKRHSIVWKDVGDELQDMDHAIAEEWHERLKVFTHGYEAKDIFNASETSLFYKMLPTRPVALNDGDGAEGKLSKEKLTVLLCANREGKMETPLVIGEAGRPSCFKNIDISGLPVSWRATVNAWMTPQIMEEFLKNFDSKMKAEGRKVILFLDNATCHPRLKLENVKIAWFPPNITITQPMDQGIIRHIKAIYRQCLLQSLTANMPTSRDVHELAEAVTVLDAVTWIAKACKEIAEDAVANCFTQAGFSGSAEGSDSDISEILETISMLCSRLNLPDDADAYINMDNDVWAHSEYPCTQDLSQTSLPSDDNDDDEEAPENEKPNKVEAIQPNIKTFNEALNSIRDLQEFALYNNCPELLEPVMAAKTCVENILSWVPKSS